MSNNNKLLYRLPINKSNIWRLSFTFVRIQVFNTLRTPDESAASKCGNVLLVYNSVLIRVSWSGPFRMLSFSLGRSFPRLSLYLLSLLSRSHDQKWQISWAAGDEVIFVCAVRAAVETLFCCSGHYCYPCIYTLRLNFTGSSSYLFICCYYNFSYNG